MKGLIVLTAMVVTTPGLKSLKLIAANKKLYGKQKNIFIGSVRRLPLLLLARETFI